MHGKAISNPAAALAATVTVMDQHGKVVHNGGKTFFSAFKEAKEAYRRRKAEIALERQDQRRAREGITRRHSHHHGPSHGSSHSPSHNSRRISDAVSHLAIQNGSSAESTAMVQQRKRHRKHKTSAGSDTGSDTSTGGSGREMVAEDALVRQGSAEQQHQADDGTVYAPSRAHQLAASQAALDMAPALFNDPSVVAVQALLARVQSIIDELQCWAAGLSTMIAELQKTPETFAAVGLSLAEISQMLTHIAPGAMIVLKAAFPTVFALISSPHFAIIAGVGTAATVVILGGYKIVRSIMAGADDNLRLAYGDEPDEAILGGGILGEIVEDPPLVVAAARRPEPVEEVVVAVPNKNKALPPPPPQANRGHYSEPKKREKVHSAGSSSQGKGSDKEDKKKDDKRHDKDRKDRDKEKDKRAKDHKERDNKDKGKAGARKEPHRRSSSSSTTSTGRSDTGLSDKSSGSKSKDRDGKLKDRDGKPKDKDGKQPKDKKKGIIKALFNGKST